MVIIATINSEVNHYGSTVVGAVLSTIQDNPPNFLFVEGVQIMTVEDLIDTPSHLYVLIPPLSHSHNNQIVDELYNTFVTVEGNLIVCVGDKNTANDTRVDSEIQNFVSIT